MHQNKNQNGFIPMVVVILLLLGAVVWFSFKHVSDAHRGTKVINTVKQNEDLINR